MVRWCIVPDCQNNDIKILSHRFPLKAHLALKWLQSLNLQQYKIEELEKFVVCTMHFDLKDYRNAISHHLNSTAIPKLSDVKPRIESQISSKERIEDDISLTILTPETVLNENTVISHNEYEYEYLEHTNSQKSEENEFIEVEVLHTEAEESILSSESYIEDLSDNEAYEIEENIVYQVPEEQKNNFCTPYDLLTRDELIYKLISCEAKIDELEEKLKKYENNKVKMQKIH